MMPTKQSQETPKFPYCTANEINGALTDIVQFILDEFVNDWYTEITTNQDWQLEIQRVFSIVFLNLESRILSIDWNHFILNDLVQIIRAHLQEINQCYSRLGTAYAGNIDSIEELFQQRNPHIALVSAADSELLYLRTLAREILLLVLPPEAAADDACVDLLKEIVSNMIFRKNINLFSDPNTLYTLILEELSIFSSNEKYRSIDLEQYISRMPANVDDSSSENGPDSLGKYKKNFVTIKDLISEAVEDSMNINSKGPPKPSINKHDTSFSPANFRDINFDIGSEDSCTYSESLFSRSFDDLSQAKSAILEPSFKPLHRRHLRPFAHKRSISMNPKSHVFYDSEDAEYSAFPSPQTQSQSHKRTKPINQSRKLSRTIYNKKYKKQVKKPSPTICKSKPLKTGINMPQLIKSIFRFDHQRKMLDFVKNLDNQIVSSEFFIRSVKPNLNRIKTTFLFFKLCTMFLKDIIVFAFGKLSLRDFKKDAKNLLELASKKFSLFVQKLRNPRLNCSESKETKKSVSSLKHSSPNLPTFSKPDDSKSSSLQATENKISKNAAFKGKNKGTNLNFGATIFHLLFLLDGLLLFSYHNSWMFVQIMFYLVPIFVAFLGKHLDVAFFNLLSSCYNEKNLVFVLRKIETKLREEDDDSIIVFRTPEQEQLLLNDATNLVAELIPEILTILFYGISPADRIIAARNILKPIQVGQLNKYLIYAALDNIVGKIFPELLEPPKLTENTKV
ncbi:hypothetical protein BB560_002518 [Smittium megazygosporum]|uniref:PXA domain-containing protein n=1 Tax=Smittium megazygosporum TaxID=133381 RepID=A0A2T9ZEK0_9FUNG|nr:hypothetical protein BB560_002518 [Smittium megazygosporum]